MTRIYESKGLNWRSNLSVGIMIPVVLWGLWELWSAFGNPDNQDPTGAMFGVLFVGGGIYGFYKTLTDNRDLVAAVDADFDTKRIVFTLWRPLRTETMEESFDRLTWRYWVKVGSRNARNYFLFVQVAGYPRPLQIELRRGEPVSEGLRRLVPDAIAEFERDTGARREEAGKPA